MDFLEELFKISKRNYQKSGGVFHDKDHKDDDHDDDDDKRRQYSTKSYTQVPAYRPQVTSSPAFFYPVSFAAGVPRKLLKAQSFVTVAEQPLN